MKLLVKPNFTNPIRVSYHTAWVLVVHEIKRNRLAYLFPLILLFLLYLSSFIFRAITISKSIIGMSFIGFYTVLAMTYGLLAFSGDQDHKTLDFMISRPIPPYLILGVKYGISGLILLGWYILFQQLFPLHWDSLPLPKGVNEHWLTLLVLTIHAISLLAGLLSKGLERFFMVIVTTSGVAYLCYFVWNQLFQLMTANYYWYDIPPVLMKTLSTGIPLILTVLGLLIPLTVAMWQLRNRLPLSQFRPGQITIAVWLSILIGVGLLEMIFAPVLYPIPTAKYGDWHETSGIIIAKTIDPKYAFHRIPDNQQIPCQLLLSKPNRKSRVIYQGNNLMFPRFSPDGKSVVFSEADVLRVIDLKTKHVITIGPGRTGAWSDDGQRIIFNRQIGPQGLSQLYEYHCSNQTLRELTSQTFCVADLLWNPTQNELLIVDFDQSLHHLNLSDLSIHTTPFKDIDESHVVFGITRPIIRLDPENEYLVLGYIMHNSLKIHLYDLHEKEFKFIQEITDFRLKSDAPVFFKPDLSAILWPRIDGGFTYEATKYHVDRDHELSHHDPNHSHEHSDEHDHQHESSDEQQHKHSGDHDHDHDHHDH